MSKKEQTTENLNNYAKYSAIVFQMGAVIALGVYGGVKTDQALELKTPVFTIILSLLSVCISLYIVLKDFIKHK